MWQIKYSDEAASYAIDSHPYNEDVLLAIEDLALMPTGIPKEHCELFEDPSTYLWEVADHEVIYERFTEENLLYIWIVKPL